MKSRMLFALFFVAATAAQAQTKAPSGKFSDGVVRIGLILEMASLYADITG